MSPNKLTKRQKKAAEKEKWSRKRDGDYEVRIGRIQPRSENQALYIDSIENNDLTIGLGSAGSGKTFVATALACDHLFVGKTRKIIMTRPVVECDEKLGFLPGTMEEKMAEWIIPITQVMKERMGKGNYEECRRKGEIEVSPFSMMRGRTFDNCVIVLDEAQNVSRRQMEMFLTRIGENCTVIINGDQNQSDLRGENGLSVLLKILKRKGEQENIGLIQFTSKDVVRSDLCKFFVEAFEDIRACNKNKTPYNDGVMKTLNC